MTARVEKGLSQKDLALKISETTGVIRDFESGKATGDANKILSKLERVLGVKLRGGWFCHGTEHAGR